MSQTRQEDYKKKRCRPVAKNKTRQEEESKE